MIFLGKLMLHIIKNTLLLTAIVSGFISTSSALADDVPTVVVSASRTHQSTITIPTNIKVISREKIEASGASNFAEIIRSIGGVHVTDLYGDGSQATVSMRGFSNGTAASNTLVIVDGRRLNNIDMNGPDLNSISVKDIEQVEIIQSSAGVLYGDQAVGGVINVVTRKPEGFAVDAKVQTGSYDRNRFQARLSDKVGEDVSYAVSGDFLRADNYRDNNKQDNMNVLGRVDYEFTSGSIFAEHQRIVREQELPGALFLNEVESNRRQSTANFQDDYLDTVTEVSRIGTKSTLTDHWYLEAELASRDYDYASVQSSSFGPSTSVYEIDSEQIEFTPRVIGVLPFNDGEAIVTTGVDYINAEYQSAFAGTTSLKDEQDVLSYYAQAVVPVFKQTTVTLGRRSGRVENDMVSSFTNGVLSDRFSAYELGIQSKVSESLSLFARYDENFRFAKIDELSFSTPGVVLNTQTGDSKELGLEWSRTKYLVTAQLYRLELEDEIAYDPGADGPFGPGTGANVNLDPTTHDGLILEANYVLNKDVSVNGVFTYTDARFDTGPFSGNKISGVPERKLSFVADYQVVNGIKTYLEAIYTDEHFVSGDNANVNDKLASYTLVNANIKYSWDDLELSVRVNNLFDKQYTASANESFGVVSFFPSPERNFWLSVAVKF